MSRLVLGGGCVVDGRDRDADRVNVRLRAAAAGIAPVARGDAQRLGAAAGVVVQVAPVLEAVQGGVDLEARSDNRYVGGPRTGHRGARATRGGDGPVEG